MLTQREKLKKAIELLKKGTPMREIGKELHLSYTTICLIKRKITSYSNEEKAKSTTEISEASPLEYDSSMATVKSISKSASKHSKGLKLLMEKKSLVEISIILDLEVSETLKIYNDYLILQKMEKVATILFENKNNLDAFISLQNRLVKNDIDVKKVWSKINLEQENFNLKEENNTLKQEMETAEGMTEFWIEHFNKVNDKYQNLLKLAKRNGLICTKSTLNKVNTHFE